MATKGGQRGRYICKVGFYDVYAEDAMRKKPGRKETQEVKATVYDIYHAKRLVEKGFNTKDMAVEKAQGLLVSK